MGNAVGERQKLGWCAPCFKTWQSRRHIQGGKEIWTEPRGMHERTGWDSRPGKED
jgi:hypothetical protein